MLNESKVKLMTRMAMYESKQGEEDFKISSYYKKDYRSFHTIATIIWVTVGYAVAVGTANALSPSTGSFDIKEMQKLLPQVQITRL